jgi:hypothetical protein
MIDGGALPTTLLQHHHDRKIAMEPGRQRSFVAGTATPGRVFVLFAVAVSKNLEGGNHLRRPLRLKRRVVSDGDSFA